jgi:hypothetical protein
MMLVGRVRSFLPTVFIQAASAGPLAEFQAKLARQDFSRSKRSWLFFLKSGSANGFSHELTSCREFARY